MNFPLYRRACQAMSFLPKNTARLIKRLLESALLVTPRRNTKSSWETIFKPFCKIALASGAEWTCNGNGKWQLFKTNGVPEHTAVLELLEQLWLPAGVRFDSLDHHCVLRLKAFRLAHLHHLGLALPVEYLQRAANAQCNQCHPKCLLGAEQKPSHAKARQSQKDGDDAGLIHSAINQSLDPCGVCFHRSTPSVDGLFGDIQLTEGCCSGQRGGVAR